MHHFPFLALLSLFSSLALYARPSDNTTVLLDGEGRPLCQLDSRVNTEFLPVGRLGQEKSPSSLAICESGQILSAAVKADGNIQGAGLPLAPIIIGTGASAAGCTMGVDMALEGEAATPGSWRETLRLAAPLAGLASGATFLYVLGKEVVNLAAHRVPKGVFVPRGPFMAAFYALGLGLFGSGIVCYGYNSPAINTPVPKAGIKVKIHRH